jgi:hypothetical protein
MPDSLQRTTINGQDATVAYLTFGFELADPGSEDMIKVMFDDGRVMFGFRDQGQAVERGVDALVDSLNRLDSAARADFDPSEPRKAKGEEGGGEWTSGGGGEKGALGGSKGHPALISTANPTGVGRSATEREAATAKTRRYQRAGIAAMQTAPELFKINVGLFKNADFYPYLRKDEVGGAPAAVAESVKQRMVDNLVFLATKVKDGAFGDKEDFKSWAHWYEGAHTLAEGYAKKYGTGIASASGVIAALSPQNDWSTNVYQADVVMDALTNKRTMAWDDKMTGVEKLWTNPDLKALLPHIKELKTLEAIEAEGGPLMSTRMAIWIRTENQAHSTRHYRNVLPSGELGDIVMTAGKNPHATPARWKSADSIANAVEAYLSKGDLSQLSVAMGARHKVRSFFNNILDPDSPNGDVTVDTHAVGAAFLYPSTGNDVPVVHALASTLMKSKQPKGYKGAAMSGVAGVSGTYGVYADAYREAAEKLHIQPRQLQSIVWEAKQRLFSKTATGEVIKRNIDAVWRRFHDGQLNLRQAQDEVFRVARETMK